MTDFVSGKARGAAVRCANLWKVYGPNAAKHLSRIRSGKVGPKDAQGHTAAVQDVSFAVAPGETFVVMGLSGSGKSTLIRCLSRLIEPTSGDVSLDDVSITKMGRKELRDFRRKDCAMVFQHFGLLPHRKVVDNAAFGLEVTGIDRSERVRRATEVLDLVGLAGWGGRYPDELSGGMKQRVGLARALAVNPRLLLLDEPFSALDPLIRRELQDELVRLAKVMNQTSIFITHDMAEALKVGDRIAIMRDGLLQQIGTPEEIVLRPANDYVRRFAEDASRLKAVSARTVATAAVTVESDADATDALRRASSTGVDNVVVLDSTGTPESVLSTERLRDLSNRGASVSQQAAPRPLVVDGGAVLETLLPGLQGCGPAVVVVDDDRRVLGVVDNACVVQALAAAMSDPMETLPATG
jgi:glycine betaine/proline transport system ATP-binding protein